MRGLTPRLALEYVLPKGAERGSAGVALSRSDSVSNVFPGMLLTLPKRWG